MSLRSKIGLLTDLAAMRQAAADQAFSTFDFSNARVSGTGRWEFDQSGEKYTRTIFFVNPDAPEGDTVQGQFTVRFQSKVSATVRDSYAMLNGNLVGEVVDPLWPTFEVVSEQVTTPACMNLGLTTSISAKGLNPRAAVATPAAASLFTAYGDLVEALVEAQAALPPRYSLETTDNLTDKVVAEAEDALNASEIVAHIHDLHRRGASAEKLRKEFSSIPYERDKDRWHCDLRAVNATTNCDGLHAEVFAIGDCGQVLTMAMTSTHYAAILVHAKTVANSLVAARNILPTAWAGVGEMRDVIGLVDAALKKVEYDRVLEFTTRPYLVTDPLLGM